MAGRAGGTLRWGSAAVLLLAVAAIGAGQTDCMSGPAVAEPHANRGLAADCAALLAARQEWTGGGLNWSADVGLDEWAGVSVDPSRTRVTRVSLAWQGLEGGIPAEFARLTELESLDLSHNRLHGSIPAALAFLTDLERLDLSHNQLNGAIPGELGALADMETLDLAGNRLSGGIPRALAGLTDLEVLDLRYNELGGTIPSELGALADLQTLNLAGNRLSGNIPGELGGLAELERLDLAYNRLSGEIPAELDNLTDLEVLHLAGNALSGPIPARLARLASLEVLDLSANKLDGGIPPALVLDLRRLEVLNLADNDLGGVVPAALRARRDLTVDLSGNPLLDEEPEPRSTPVLDWVSNSHRIRIDRVDNRPRYASWRAGAAPGDDPDLLLSNGRTIQEVGGRSTLYYLFTTGAYRYVIMADSGAGPSARTGCLFVYQGRDRIRAEPIRPVQSAAESDPRPDSCDVDIHAKIERWLEMPE